MGHGHDTKNHNKPNVIQIINTKIKQQYYIVHGKKVPTCLSLSCFLILFFSICGSSRIFFPCARFKAAVHLCDSNSLAASLFFPWDSNLVIVCSLFSTFLSNSLGSFFFPFERFSSEIKSNLEYTISPFDLITGFLRNGVLKLDCD